MLKEDLHNFGMGSPFVADFEYYSRSKNCSNYSIAFTLQIQDTAGYH